jgi:hypothetical protein
MTFDDAIKCVRSSPPFFALTHPPVRPWPQESKMKKIALAIIVLIGLGGTAHAQDRAHRRYFQRTDHYAQVINYWASQLSPELAGMTPRIVFGGDGIVVGTRIRCKVCDAVGHVNCGAAVPLYVSHFAWDMMP